MEYMHHAVGPFHLQKATSADIRISDVLQNARFRSIHTFNSLSQAFPVFIDQQTS